MLQGRNPPKFPKIKRDYTSIRTRNERLSCIWLSLALSYDLVCPDYAKLFLPHASYSVYLANCHIRPPFSVTKCFSPSIMLAPGLEFAGTMLTHI